MMRYLIAILLLTAVTPALADPAPEYANGLLQREGTTWDLTVAGGIRLWRGSGDQSSLWFGRARLGILRYQEPTFLILGVAAQLGPLGSRSLGAEVEIIDVWKGTWGQIGVFPIDSTPGVTIEAAAGYTLFGVEYQRRLSGPNRSDQAIVLSLHLPLGVVLAMRKEPRGVVHK